MNNCFLEENYILDNCHKLADIPVSIVHGRYDMICPPVFAFQLKEKLARAELAIVDAGHSDTEPAVERELLSALENLRSNAID